MGLGERMDKVQVCPESKQCVLFGGSSQSSV